MRDLQVDAVRFAEDWQFREKTKGVYNWQPLDARFSWLRRNGFVVMLTIQSNGPDWACDRVLRNERSCRFADVQAFREYMEALARRYRNQIDLVQFGNEWVSESSFVASVEEFIEYNDIAYHAFKRNSPATQFVLGGFSIGVLQALSFCDGRIDAFWYGNDTLLTAQDRAGFCRSEQAVAAVRKLDLVLSRARYDSLDIHLYDDVENWPIYFETIQGRNPRNVAILVGEFGGPNLYWEAPYSDELQAARLDQYLRALAQLDVAGAFYFTLVESPSASPAHLKSGLLQHVDGEVREKPAYRVFRDFSHAIEHE